MSLLSKLFSKRRPSADDLLVDIVKQTQHALDEVMSHTEYMVFIRPIQSLWDELLQANPNHTIERVEVVVCAVAQYVGLETWAKYGSSLSEKEVTRTAQAVMNMELSNQFIHLSPGGVMRELFARLLLEQSLSLQVGISIQLCSMGQESEARSLVDDAHRIALLSDGELDDAMRASS